MKKDNISRTDLKKDFLNQTLVRIDYDYMFDEDVEKTMKNIDLFLCGKGYTIKNNSLAQFGLTFNFDKLNSNINTNIIDTINVESDKREKFVSFINEQKHIKIDVTREYSAITVTYAEHICFDEICEIFEEIVKELFDSRKNLQLKRLGLRKVNVFTMKNIKHITDYFEDKVFTFSSDNLESYEFIGKNSYDNYFYKDYKVNQIANVTQGYLTKDEKSQLAYRLLLDLDIYKENPSRDTSLKDMNDSLFDIYKNSLKESFLNDLTNERFSSEEIFKI